MSSERESIKQKLDDELHEVQFTGNERVIRQIHPSTFGARLSSLWNKEIEISVKPIGAIAVIFLITSLALHQPRIDKAPHQSIQSIQSVQSPPGQRKLIEAGGNMYWKDIYDQAVKEHEN